MGQDARQSPSATYPATNHQRDGQHGPGGATTRSSYGCAKACSRTVGEPRGGQQNSDSTFDDQAIAPRPAGTRVGAVGKCSKPGKTMRQYVQTDLEADRQVANTLAELIIGGSLASTAVTAS